MSLRTSSKNTLIDGGNVPDINKPVFPPRTEKMARKTSSTQNVDQKACPGEPNNYAVPGTVYLGNYDLQARWIPRLVFSLTYT